MKKLLLILFALSFISACKKSNEVQTENKTLSGRYLGIFYRTGGDTVNVSLLFIDNNFSGSSDRAKYPAICNGTFNIEKNSGASSINFNDNCVWTADFDWSLILEGEYELSFNADNSVTIARHSLASSDYYTLWKVVR